MRKRNREIQYALSKDPSRITTSRECGRGKNGKKKCLELPAFHHARISPGGDGQRRHSLHAAEASSQANAAPGNRKRGPGEDQSVKKFLDATMLLLAVFVDVVADCCQDPHNLESIQKFARNESSSSPSLPSERGSMCISADTKRRYSEG